MLVPFLPREPSRQARAGDRRTRAVASAPYFRLPRFHTGRARPGGSRRSSGSRPAALPGALLPRPSAAAVAPPIGGAREWRAPIGQRPSRPSGVHKQRLLRQSPAPLLPEGRREGERNSECAKAFPAVPGRHGEGTKTNADGSGRGQGSLPSRSQFTRVRPRVPDPPPAQRWYGSSCPGAAVGGRGCHVRPVGGSSAFPCAGSGGLWAVQGTAPAAIPALSSGAPLQPALARLTAGRTGLGFPRVRLRAASGECG